jgi:hypothetical protein
MSTFSLRAYGPSIPDEADNAEGCQRGTCSDSTDCAAHDDADIRAVVV